jgi:molecular chaperone DnaK
MAEIVGIDLGTTKSAVAIWRDGAPVLIPNARGQHVTPSLVAFDDTSGRWAVGEEARAIELENPRAAVYAIKRFMGRRIRDEAVQEDLTRARILYDVIEAHDRPGGIEVAIADKRLTPQEVSAKILAKLKHDVETELGHEIVQAVITVPAYFDDAQRQATRDAGHIAGLQVKRVLNEPTAACLAFGYTRLREERHTVGVFDLGGGTFDISILEVGRGPFWVRATNGDTHLGGNDLDWLIVDWVMGHLRAEEQQVLRSDVRALVRLRAAAEEAKRELSADATSSHIRLTSPHGPHTDIRDLDVVLTRATLDALAKDWIERTLIPCRQALHDAGLKPSDMREVLLVGGQTKMPAIRRAVHEFFGIEPNVAINPEEAVALGAAVTGAILAREATGLKLADVVPLSLGVKTRGGKMDVLIPRNTQVPVALTRSYSTFWENQESVEVQVYQGERPMVADNVPLGNFVLSGIEPSPAGQPEIQVTFRVDENGILEVTGKDVRTGAAQKITVTESSRLSDEEIEAMIRRAREHRAEDAARLEEADARNQAEIWARRLGELVKKRAVSVPADLRTAIDEALATQPNDWTTYKQELERLWHRANEKD